MAGGPMFPSSIYLGGASGNLSSTIFVPSTNTNAAGAIEGIGVIGSLGSDSTAVLQFNLPETIPTGTCKLRTLMWAPDAHAGKLPTTRLAIAVRRPSLWVIPAPVLGGLTMPENAMAADCAAI